MESLHGVIASNRGKNQRLGHQVGTGQDHVALGLGIGCMSAVEKLTLQGAGRLGTI